VVKGDLLFTLADDGVASCLVAKTGELKWQKRLEGDYSASPLIAGDRIYCFSQDGDCPVFAAADEFELLAENQLDEGFMASPAVMDDALILRTRTHVYRVEAGE
jgi:outer membrane protein assembly factor BamB